MAPAQLVSEHALSSIGERLKAAREQAGYTLDELATLTGLSKAHLSRLESAERQPSIAALLTFAAALRVPVGRLLGEEDQASSAPLSLLLRRRGAPRGRRVERGGLQRLPGLGGSRGPPHDHFARTRARSACPPPR